jgi:6-phosphofructokinase 1
MAAADRTAKRLGILTGGGDCPGLNAVIRAVVRVAERRGAEVIGLRLGWKGLLQKLTRPLTPEDVLGILPRGGTIIGTSRTNPAKEKDGVARCQAAFRELGLDVLIAVGGEDTLGFAARLHAQGVPIIGVPKTIDNDLDGTDQTFGFDTALQIATDAVDRLHTTAESHERVMVVEIMGRHAGWIALYSGLAGGADAILIPEQETDLGALCDLVKKRYERGRRYAMIVAAEGAKLSGEEITQEERLDAFGHVRLGGLGERLAREIEKRTGCESRHVVLGHLQRGGTPTAFDRILATRFGVSACELALEGKSGVMVALRGTRIVPVPLQEAVASLRTVPPDLHRLASIFSG